MKNRLIVLPLLMAFILTAAACGGGGGSAEKSGGADHSAAAKAPAKTETAPAAQTAAPAAGGGMTAVVKGSVKFAGTAPKFEKIKMDADPVCKGLHTAPIMPEEVVVNANGTLQWVMVYVKDGLGGKTFPVPAAPVVLDQKGCTYHPHIFGMMAGQGLKILNSDATLHNIHPLPKVNKGFNVGMPKPGEIMKNFEMAEDPFHIKCDVHKWMSSYCGVFTHPFFSVTNESGAFELKGLPAGTYTVVAWHEKYGAKEMSVTVGDGESKDVEFSFAEGA
ncbi:MAG: carboxypeptidase regulatory-like domain-containing protein [bacterium]